MRESASSSSQCPFGRWTEPTAITISSNATATATGVALTFGNNATLKFGASNQLPTTANITMASNGAIDMKGTGGRDQTVNNLTMEVGSLGGATVNLGTGTLTLNGTGTIAVQALGGNNATGASITGAHWGLRRKTPPFMASVKNRLLASSTRGPALSQRNPRSA